MAHKELSNFLACFLSLVGKIQISTYWQLEGESAPVLMCANINVTCVHSLAQSCRALGRMWSSGNWWDIH